ncbi:MAG: adenosylcobinamide-GDP ribazoletransferase, partial [Pseudomonadota bacterium]
FLPPARPGGLSHHVGRPPLASTALALAITTVIALFILGHAAPAVLFGAGLTTMAVGVLAMFKIGGQTGDVLGATQQSVELTVLLILVGLNV